jgi:hypothetical protein
MTSDSTENVSSSSQSIECMHSFNLSIKFIKNFFTDIINIITSYA